MASSQFPNYLRANRKRLGLSQEDVSFLLGVHGGEKMCRYERFNRGPSLQVALACEVIFQRAASEIFNGLYQKVEREVVARAVLLTKKALNSKDPRSVRRNQVIAAIAARYKN